MLRVHFTYASAYVLAQVANMPFGREFHFHDAMWLGRPLAAWTLQCTARHAEGKHLYDEGPSRLEVTGHLFQPRGPDPAVRIRWLTGHHALVQLPCSLDVTHLCG